MAGSVYYSLEDWAFRKRLMLAVVFTDIVGSTSLRKQLGDEAMEGIIQQHFANAGHYIGQNDGYQIKTIGDEVMAVFPTAGDALNYVLDLYDNTGHAKIKIRATIHVGTVTVVENDIRGTMVHLAARVSKLPRGANIYVTDDAQIQITQVKAQRHGSLVSWRRKVQIKDFETVTQVWDVRTPKMRELAKVENLKRLATSSTQATTAASTKPSLPSRVAMPNIGSREEVPRVLELPTRTITSKPAELLTRLAVPPQQRDPDLGLRALLGDHPSTRKRGNTLAELFRRADENEKKR